MSRPRPFQFLALAATACLTACGGGDNGTEPPTPPANQAPQAVGTLSAVTVSVGESVPVDVASSFRDPDGDALTYAASSSDAGVAGASVAGSVVSVTGVAAGTATITVTARDPGGLTATQPLSVAVNAAPEPVGEIPLQELTEGDTATLDLSGYFTDPNGDALRYEAWSSDQGVATATIDGGTAAIAALEEGTTTITFTASDPAGLSATQDAIVIVESGNSPPEPTDSIPAQQVTAGESTTLDLSGHFTDPDGDTLSYEATTSDAAVATVAIDGSEATIAGVAEGSATLTFVATDPAGASAAQEAAVTVLRPNRAPTAVGTIDTVTVNQGGSVELIVSGYFSDPDGDALAYAAASSDDEVATASVTDSTLTIAGEQGGTATITVTATDPGGLSADQEAVVRVNQPPVPADTLPDHDMMRGKAVELDVAAYFADPDGDALTYGATTSNADLATASVDGSVVTTSAAAPDTTAPPVDTLTLTVTATDAAGLTVEQMALVRVSAMEYDTLPGIGARDDGTLVASLGGSEVPLTTCLTLPETGLVIEGSEFKLHWSVWQRAAGTGWITVQSHQPRQICPIRLAQDQYPPGVYRLVGDATIDDNRGIYRTPSVEKKPPG